MLNKEKTRRRQTIIRHVLSLLYHHKSDHLEKQDQQHHIQDGQNLPFTASMLRINGLALLFYLCFFLFTSSGRLASGDAGTQLQAAMLLANTGRIGTETPPTDAAGGHGLWVKNREGQFYQCHDIGNVILMYPAAWVSSIRSKSPVAARIQSPPILARVATALTYSVLSAVGCFFMFRLFALYYSVRAAFLLSFSFVTTTIFWPYTKSAWDVLGASCFVCILLYFSAKLLTSAIHDQRDTRPAQYTWV
jgi:hypothetical protein